MQRLFKIIRVACVSVFIMMAVDATAHAGVLYFGPSLFVQDITTTNANYRGLHPRFSVGYAALMEDLFLAAEVFGVPTTANISDNHCDGVNELSVRATRSLGLSFMPGLYIIDNVLAYLRLGVVNTLFTAPNTYRSGGQAGLGLGIGLSSYWDLRAEYIYTAYHTAAGIGAPKSDQVGIGLVYKVLG